MFLVLFGCKWYGMVYHSSLVPFPLRTGMILPFALFRTCWLSPIEMHFCYSLFCDHRQLFREMNSCDDIIIIGRNVTYYGVYIAS